MPRLPEPLPHGAAAPAVNPAMDASRRALLGGTAAMAAAAAVPAAAAAEHPDAALLRMAAEILALGAETDQLDALHTKAASDRSDEQLELACGIRERLADARAVTLDGLRAKARAWAALTRPDALKPPQDLTDHLGWSITRDLLGWPIVTCDELVAEWRRQGPDAEEGEGQSAAEAPQPFRRTPGHITAWLTAAENEFPVFGMAEVLLGKTDQDLIDGWRALPEAMTEFTTAFWGIGNRWLDGAEAMHAVGQRMLATKTLAKREDA